MAKTLKTSKFHAAVSGLMKTTTRIRARIWLGRALQSAQTMEQLRFLSSFVSNEHGMSKIKLFLDDSLESMVHRAYSFHLASNVVRHINAGRKCGAEFWAKIHNLSLFNSSLQCMAERCWDLVRAGKYPAPVYTEYFRNVVTMRRLVEVVEE